MYTAVLDNRCLCNEIGCFVHRLECNRWLTLQQGGLIPNENVIDLPLICMKKNLNRAFQDCCTFLIDSERITVSFGMCRCILVGCGCTVNFIVCSCRLIACVQGKDKARALFCTGYCTSCGSVSAGDAEEAALNKRSVAGAAATASVIRPSVTINTFTVEAAGSALSFIDDTFLTGLSSLSSAGKSAQTTSFGHFWRLSLKIATQKRLA
jgi:hypothetical protein